MTTFFNSRILTALFTAGLVTAAFAGLTITSADADGPAIDATKPTASTAKSDNPFADLLRIDDSVYRVTADDSVSTDALSVANVRKIGYGHVQNVRIVTTSTGTYSTDALTSAHVLYPGVDSELVAEADGSVVGFLTHGVWVLAPLRSAHSFVHFGHMQGGGGYVTDGHSSCVAGKGFAGCF